MKLDGIAAFVTVVEQGAISAASRHLGLAKSVVSERLAELERSIGARLVQRTTRKLSLTEDGHSFLPRARRILNEASEARSEISERRGTLLGPMRIAAPVGFGVVHLGPALYAFLARHPDIDLSLELDDRFVDAAADGFDAVLRHGPIADNRLIAKKLATSRRHLVASQGYLAAHGTPSSIADLAGHRGILYTNRDSDWRFAGEGGWEVIRPRAALRVNNGLVMRDAAIAGLGLSLLPNFFIHAELRDRSLVKVDVGAEPEGAELHIAYPRNRRTSAKVEALIESLRGSFGDPPYWDR
jgi:DNA-binding transcriptional LysR family regulator